MGRSRRSPLAPWFRSENQARVLATMFLSSEPMHLRAVADRAEVPYSVAQREITRLEDFGLVTSQRLGRSRVVHINEDHPQAEPLRQLLLATYGPRAVLADLLADVRGIEDAFLFGSWASRYRGEEGPDPADVDVLIVGNPDRQLAGDIAARAEDMIGRPVEVTVVSPESWTASSSGFLKTLRTRSLVRLFEESE